MPTMTIPAEAIARQGFGVYFPQLDARAADLNPVWDHVRRIIWDSETALFQKEGRLEEFPVWAPLAPRYAAWKRRKHGGRKILAISGKLRGQLTGRARGWYEDRQLQSFALGTDYTDFSGVEGRPRSPRDSLHGHDLGGIHAEGREYQLRYRLTARGETRPRTMPARPPLRIPWVVEDRIAQIMVDYVTNHGNEWEGPRGGRIRPNMRRYTY